MSTIRTALIAIPALGLATTLSTTALTATARAAKAPKETPALLAKGKAAFNANCVPCHGERGDGNGPLGKALTPKPRAFATEPFKQGDSPEQVYKTISEGVPGTPMVGFPALPEEDRWGLAYYVLKLKRGAK
jgi:high-affinity iron transporter